MNWFLLSFGCAFFTATTATCSKLSMRKYAVLFVGWIRFALSLPILLALLCIYKPNLQFSIQFWKVFMVLLPIEAIAFLIYLVALKRSPLSLTFPFLGLTPAFSILASYLILREKPSIAGAAGVVMVSIGAYLLNADAIKRGVLEPIKNIYREKGSLLMVLVALLYSFTSVLGKKAVLMSSPLSFAAVYYAVFFAVFAPLVFMQKKPVHTDEQKTRFKDIVLLLVLGVSFTISVFLHFYAILLTNVAYMISVKRLSLVISVLYGVLIFKERHIGFRLLGSMVMVLGVMILAFA